MLMKVRRWGNSRGLRFTKAILEEARIDVGDRVSVTVREGRIIVEPVATVRGMHDLKTLVSAMPEGHRVEEPGRGLRPRRHPRRAPDAALLRLCRVGYSLPDRPPWPSGQTFDPSAARWR